MFYYSAIYVVICLLFCDLRRYFFYYSLIIKSIIYNYFQTFNIAMMAMGIISLGTNVYIYEGSIFEYPSLFINLPFIFKYEPSIYYICVTPIKARYHPTANNK